MDKHKDTSWNKVAGWYDQHVSEASDHHRDIIIPGALRMLDPKKGEKIIDIGCGQGILCRELAAKGVEMTGIDSSKKLIDIAKTRAQGKNIDYKISDASNMKAIPDGFFDAAVSILALQNMSDLDRVMAEAARILNAKGRMLMVLNHPCFRIPRQSGWGFDEKRKLQYRRVDRYMTPLKIPIQMRPGAAPDIHTWTFHKPISEYFRVFTQLGMVVTALEEWVSKRKSLPGKTSRMENQSREEIPLFLAMLAVKLN